MLKTYRYRLYPTIKQAELLDKHIGACRFVYNLALETKNYAYVSQRKNITCFDLMKQLPDLKNECEWLKEIDSQSLQQSIINLDKAFSRFFKGCGRFPAFKNKKTSAQSFRNPHGSKVVINGNKISFPKFNEIRFIQDREIKGAIKNNTVSRTPSGKYYVSILVEDGSSVPSTNPAREGSAIGIDLGLSHFAITSDGIKVDNPRCLRNSLGRLKVLQRRMRNKKKGSQNKKKANLKIALIHEKITNQRKDFLNKLSTQLVRDNQTICMEDLNINGMMANHCLAQAVSDVSWAEFVRQIRYKCEWYGKKFLQIPRFEPSTKICSNCGASNKELTLKDRSWTCKCGSFHDRDINAAINIKNYCLKNSGKGIPAVPVEMRTIVRSAKREVEMGGLAALNYNSALKELVR